MKVQQPAKRRAWNLFLKAGGFVLGLSAFLLLEYLNYIPKYKIRNVI